MCASTCVGAHTSACVPGSHNLCCFLPYVARKGLSLSLTSTLVASQIHLSPYPPPTWCWSGLQTHAILLSFSMSARDLNSDPHIWAASALPVCQPNIYVSRGPLKISLHVPCFFFIEKGDSLSVHQSRVCNTKNTHPKVSFKVCEHAPILMSLLAAFESRDRFETMLSDSSQLFKSVG